MLRRAARPALCAALVALAAPVVGQIATPTPAPSPDVVVTARARAEQARMERRVRAIARRSDGQVARFDLPVCAGAIGLPPELAARASRRIAALATRAGIRTAPAGCRPNLTLVVVDDGRKLVSTMRQRHPSLVAGIPTTELDRIESIAGPVRVLTLTEIRSRDGERLSSDYTQGNTGLAGGAPTLRVDAVSLITMTTRQDITGALVLVDADAILGKGLFAIADHAAMRGLAKTNAADPGTAGDGEATILSLFSADDAPREATDFDLAFLRALYAGAATQPYAGKVREIARAILKAQAAR
jgi:hypothetical protein